GPLIAKSLGAQGDNVRFYNNYFSGFTLSCAQVGGNNAGLNAGRVYAQNALLILFEGGDMQACPNYGLAVYGGSAIVRDMTMENGTTNQTGYDFYCEASQGPCIMEHVRSESFKPAAGEGMRIRDITTPFYGVQWYNPNGSQSLSGTTSSVGQIISGTGPGGDGRYYVVTRVGVYGGLPLTTATSGSTTTIVKSSASWTANAFVGQQVTIISGTASGLFCVITSNNATTLTCSAGWKSNY